jgi:hypothetical protein
MNRTGDQTCFLFSCRDCDSVSNFAQAYSEAIQDKEKTLSILRINPGATRGGLSQRGHRLPAWVRRHLEAELHGMTKESEQLPAQDLPALNDSLKSRGQQPLSLPPAKVGAIDATHGSGGVAGSASLPADFHISW